MDLMASSKTQATPIGITLAAEGDGFPVRKPSIMRRSDSHRRCLGTSGAESIALTVLIK
jgi:hypothetical protein